MKSGPPVSGSVGRRKLHNATLLADGKVLVTGGSRGPEKVSEAPSANSAAYECEIWNPDTGQWSVKASLGVFRGYHSIALLLPDGRVLSAGGDFAGPRPYPLKASAEIYSPPYLFNGNDLALRPTITDVTPANTGYGARLVVKTPNASDISKVTMVALGSVTHGFNMGQRINFPSFAPHTNADQSVDLWVTTPANENRAPTGYYMLFILNGNGVPSIAKFVRLNVP